MTEIEVSRPVTPQRAEDTSKPLKDALKEVLGVAGDVLGDRPAYIASDDDRGPLSEAVRAISQYNCRVWAAADKSRFSDRVNSGNAELCGPYLDTIGENPGDAETGLPFTGGQCVGINYRGSFTATGADGNCGPTNFGNPNFGAGPGPLNIRKVHDTSASGPMGGLCPGFSYNKVVLINGAGETTLVGQARGIRLTSLSFTREDGQPDNCGNPGDQIEPPGRSTPVTPIPPEITVNVPGLGPVDIDVTLDPDGNPIVCIDELNICATIDIGAEGPGGGDGGNGLPPGDIGEPGQSEPTGSGGEAEGEAPPDSVLVGLKLDLLAVPANPNEYAPGVYRGAAYIYMGVPGSLDQDFAGSMLEDGQFVFAEKDNLTAWKVRANLGYNWRVTPYYRESE